MKKFELVQQAGLVRQSDLSKEITLRNANAHRRLEGELKHLDEQLHQRLVTVQADIADLKLSRYSSGTRSSSRSPARSPIPGRKSCRTPDISNSSGAQPALNHYRRLPVINVQTEITESQQMPKNEANSSAMFGKDVQATPHTFYSLKGQSRPSQSAILSRRGDTFVRNRTTKNCKSSLAVSPNICRPSSSPDLRVRNCSGTDISGSPSLARRKLPPLERSNRETPSQRNSDLLSERVKDFVKRPNSNLGERNTITKNGSNMKSLKTSVEQMQISSAVNNVNNNTTSQPDDKDNQQEHFAECESDGDKTSDDQEDKEKQLYLNDDDLFLNSNLLKAYSDSPLSASMPDLSTLGFMDYNEVIDKRLRDLQEWQHNPPTEEEMRKVKYLRFRDVQQTPDILSVFDKPE